MCAPHKDGQSWIDRAGDDHAAAARPPTPRCSSMSTAPCWKSRRGRSWSRCRRACRCCCDRLGAERERRAGAGQRPAAGRHRPAVPAVARRRRGVARRRTPPRRRQPGATAPIASRPRAAAALDRLRPMLADAARAHARRLARRQGRDARAALSRGARTRRRNPRPCPRGCCDGAGDALRLIAGKMVVELQPRQLRQGRAIAAFHRRAAVPGPPCRCFSATTRPTRTGLPRSTGGAACRSGSARRRADRGCLRTADRRRRTRLARGQSPDPALKSI